MTKKVALGLSGGVDSAASAYLLKKQGFDISCIYLNCYDNDDPQCRAKADRADALKVALHLNLPFQVLDFRQEYQAAVIDYFKSEYLSGRTPNPDVVCNRDIKFGLFLDWAIKEGFDAVATGHYAKLLCHPEAFLRHPEARRRIQAAAADTNISIASPASPTQRGELDSSTRRLAQNDADAQKSTPLLRIPADSHKDQTYFLWQVPRQKFQRVLFPLADYLKSEVRDIARKIKLPVAAKKDSTGICFVGEISVEEFLKRLGVKEKIGEVTLSNGKVIGRHKGVWFYTIGQRHGFDVTWPSSSVIPAEAHPPLYVISKDIKLNRLVVGFGPECYRDSFEVSGCNWLYQKDSPHPVRTVLKKFGCLVRLRHCGDLIPCEIKKIGDNSLKILLSAAQRGIAPGQSAVFYSKDGIVLGGGVIRA